MTLKLVVFDLDGTLVDSVDTHAEGWSFAIEYLGVARVDKSRLISLIGLPGDSIVRATVGEEGLKYYDRIRRLKDRHFLNQLASGRVSLFPDTLPCLKHLKKRNYVLGLASSSPNRVLLPLLEQLELLDYFNYIVSGDEVVRGKPDPEIFIRVARKAGVENRETIVVGDTEYDTAPARSAGMKSVLVARGRTVRVSNLNADVVVTTLADLTVIL
ncbi:MAG: HAD family hydrolase [Sulfolobales archaeon]|nr:HAD family hydrolase [Sulfolobales archaeon]MDW8082617.1 HAD family hydrolase [Sulfolobales archaeon]